MAAKTGGGSETIAEINMVPLIDIILVVLIIFMVTAPLLTAGVPVNLPDARAKPLDQDAKPVAISLEMPCPQARTNGAPCGKGRHVKRGGGGLQDAHAG